MTLSTTGARVAALFTLTTVVATTLLTPARSSACAVCEAGYPVVHGGDAPEAYSPIASESLIVPVYNSRPGAHAKIFLDFDGVDYQGTWAGKTPGVVPAYDTDGNPDSFSTTELNNIRQIFVRVAEKFSPFNVNVTTVDPGNGNNRETARLVIGGNNTWYGSGGGVAFVGGFYNSSSNTAWVFPKNLSNGNPKTVAEATAHEAGHLFGLSHQSTWELQDGAWVKTQEYSTNGGNTAKRPVMGTSYSSTRGLWWSGTPSGSATATQIDMNVIANANNAFGYRPDDHGNSFSTATRLVPDSLNRISASGVIEQTTDRDLFSFATGAGTISFNLAVAEFGAMLDASLQLLHSDGSVMVTRATTSLGESLSASVPAGEYAIAVYSAGNYGDVGQYTLTGTLIPIPEPAALLALAMPVTFALLRRRRL